MKPSNYSLTMTINKFSAWLLLTLLKNYSWKREVGIRSSREKFIVKDNDDLCEESGDSSFNLAESSEESAEDNGGEEDIKERDFVVIKFPQKKLCCLLLIG